MGSSKLGWLRAVARISAVALLGLGGIWSTACGSDDKPGPTIRKCTLNSDCDSNLVCSFGLCHKQCEESKDCGPGQLCVKSDNSSTEGGVCQLDQDEECKFADDCPDPLICGPDSKCRTPCRYPSDSGRDCLKGQVCALGGVCAEPEEIDKETGGIKGAPPVKPGPDGGGETCVAGGSCTLGSATCRVGTYVCEDGERVCKDTGAAADGASCGVDMVCVSGTCTGCVQNAECKPDENDPCKVGTLDCATGVRCVQGANAKDGVSCGTDKVCSGGDCVDCVQGEDCQPEQGDACVVGKRSCSKGPVCEKTGDAANGTDCGTSQVCSDGSCESCFAGGSCTPANECHQGRRTCSSGPACEDTGQNVNDGRRCAAEGEYCVNGACKACTQGDPCTPTAQADKCKEGYTYCNGGVATCSAQSANAPDGKFCADDETSACFSGVCTPLDRTIVVKSGNDPTGKIDQFTTTNVVVTVRDKNGAGVNGVQVTVQPSEPAGGVGIPATTNVSGDATIRLRLGRALGTYKFKITAVAVQTPVEVTATATAPDVGTIYSVVNADHASGTTGGTAGAGTAARINTARDVVVASDGTLYVADPYAVYKLTPAGAISLVAGKPSSSGTSGDGGQATAALLSNVVSIALDEAHNLLHIALDGSSGRIRTVNLASGIIGTTAGGGTASPPLDLGGSGLNLNLSNIEDISVSPAGDLYIIETSNSRIVRIDGSDQTSEWAKTGSCVAGGDTRISYFYQGSSLAWDASGKPYLSAYFCNLGVNPATAVTAYGVARVETGGKFVHVAGWNSSGSKSDGVPATNAYFTSQPRIVFDKAGNLYVSLSTDDVIRRIDGATFRIATVAGAPATNPVNYGDYGPATSAQFSSVGPIAFDAGNNLYLTDTSNFAIRAVWGLGQTTPSTFVLTKNGGDNQAAIPLDAQFTSMSVKLVDGAGAFIPNVPIEWARKETGSYIAERFTQTNALAGVSSNIGRVGLLAGAYTFDASYSDLHGNRSTLTFTATGVAPTAGHIYTTVNVAKIGGNTGVPGPGTFARTQYNENVVAAADGTLYLSTYYAVYTLSPRGELSLLAGAPGASGSVGQGNAGAALNARFAHVQGMALDPSRNRLYVTDGGTHVRLIDLGTGTINAFAGGGSNTANDAPLGQASFSNLNGLSLSADGKSLYGVDRGHNRLVDIQVDNEIVKNVIAGNTTCQTGVVSLYSLGSSYSSVLWLSSGEAYISGQICGTPGGNGAYGIVKRAVNGTLTLIAGNASSSATGEGIPANTAYFNSIGGMAVDSAGNLYVSVPGAARVRKITFPAGTIATVAGNGTATSGSNPAPDYVAATTSSLYNPEGLAIVRRASGDRLVIADYNNNAFREVW